jgi:hypothetical protein
MGRAPQANGRRCDMGEENTKRRKGKDFAEMIFDGCMFLGLGVGILLRRAWIGLFIGMGIGFIVKGLLWAKQKEQ